jgi:16S rRNA (guanine966-N2)-methyltransferase
MFQYGYAMRVTAGIHRSRLLQAPKGTTTRPTTDRVREALFSILAARGALADAKVLDLYAGTGALGIEALSRGAAHATFVEHERSALACLRTNVESLGETRRATILPLRAERAAGRLAGPFDLVLGDPPWADVSQAVDVLATLVSRSLVAPAAIVVLEHSSREDAPVVAGLTLCEPRTYGDTALAIYELSPRPNPV